MFVRQSRAEWRALVFQRWMKDGTYDRASVDRLDQLRPHFARAGMVSARLGLEQARATVSALETIGLPAAVMAASGRVLTSNSLLEEMTEMFLPTAYGGMAIANASANALFQRAILENR
ncbi:MAG: helix-turn-helix transcriptional regulator, partial [Mesorhizobium sp.]